MKNTMGRIARAAAAAGLSLALALGGVAPSVGLAEGEGGTGSGTLVLKRAEGNTATAYRAIKIFKADVEQDNGQWVAKDLDWATPGTERVVVAAINAYRNAHNDVPEYTGTTAQDAADFMVRYIQGTDNTTIVGPNDFANTLANYLATALIDRTVNGAEFTGTIESKNVTSTPYEATSNEVNTLTEGYYLVIADLTNPPEGSAATSPILLMMGQDQSLTINEKVKIPTIEKTVREDSAPEVEAHYADAQVGQLLPFTLKGTVSGNIANYSTYYYKFTDELPKGMDLNVSGGTSNNAFDSGDVVVKVDNSNSTTAANKGIYTITSGFTATYDTTTATDKNTLAVEFTNLLGAQGKKNPNDETTAVPIDSASIVTVEYGASLNGSAVTGVTGNTNKAHITYDTTPNVEKHGDTTDSTATVYEYSLKLVKLDKDHELDNSSTTSTPLPNAVFTIKATATDEGTNNGKYLKQDGTFGATDLPAEKAAYLFTTNEHGEITAKGLDAGTYTIHEETAPDSYKSLAADLVLKISVTKDATTGSAQKVVTELSGGEADGVDTSSPQDDALDKGTRATVDDSGNITVYATNQKEEKLPLTGLSGITLVYVAGGAILAVSLVAIVRRRMKDQS